jgi:hypothetical protein
VEKFYKAYDISYWSMPQAEAAEWLNTQFGTNIQWAALANKTFEVSKTSKVRVWA